MRNLAGMREHEATRIFRQELLNNHSDVIDLPEATPGEVKVKVEGALFDHNGNKKFTVSRRWRYANIEGLVPLEVAREMYDHPVGREVIRVAGYAGNIDPDLKWNAIDPETGLIVVSQDVFEQSKRYGLEDIFRKTYIVGDKESAPKFITLYHIDTEPGLRVFQKFMERHNVI